MNKKQREQFDFGANWTNFSSLIDKEKELVARTSLEELTKNIKGKSFLDIGSGSGLFSIAAASLGASEVVGIDLSDKCVAIAYQNKERLIPEKNNITFLQGSILDSKTMPADKYDIVYSYGVLHHTGNMEQAFKNIVGYVKPQGVLIIAIYNKHWSSFFWKGIKKIYNISPRVIRKIIIGVFYPIIFAAKFLVTRKNPLKKERGMDFFYDVVDWVGGYPYEYASIQEVQRSFVEQGMTVIRTIPAKVPTGCNEFIFQKK
ncbi:MAG: class I SAM-dependent methyltransferase [Candidatus Omnitrophica bacterium]|nr:class I SAM-dependent methyltransferase [Candidatus Omnitrophota bacterium]